MSNPEEKTKEISLEKLQEKFMQLVEQSPDEQQEAFLKSFIFALPDWKEVEKLNKAYKKYITDGGEGEPDLNFVQASDFLQKNGFERSAKQRKDEIADIDLDNNDRICFIEYLLLHFKVLILEEYYKRKGTKCPHDLSQGGKGVSGVGRELLDELFYITSTLPPELVKALEDMTALKKARSAKLKDLADKAAKGGVKGGIAAQQLGAMQEAGESREQLMMEAKINSQVRKAGKQSGGAALQKKKDVEEKAKKEKSAASRSKLAARAAMFGGK